MQRENGPGLNRGLLTLLTMITEKKYFLKCSVNFLMNVSCVHLNLKCMSRMRQSLQSELRSVTIEWPCAVAIK